MLEEPVFVLLVDRLWQPLLWLRRPSPWPPGPPSCCLMCLRSLLMPYVVRCCSRGFFVRVYRHNLQDIEAISRSPCQNRECAERCFDCSCRIRALSTPKGERRQGWLV